MWLGKARAVGGGGADKGGGMGGEGGIVEAKSLEMEEAALTGK